MLKTFKQMRQTNEEGFTLIELLVVIVIIGLLAAIALPIFLNQQKASRDAALKSDMHNAVIAMQTELVKNGGDLSKITPDPLYSYVFSSNNSNLNGWMGAPRTKGGPVASHINISEGVRMGIKVTDAKAGYCIIGIIEGGTYDGGASPLSLDTNHTLFYDSAAGKIQTKTQLSSTGGCKSIS